MLSNRGSYYKAIPLGHGLIFDTIFLYANYLQKVRLLEQRLQKPLYQFFFFFFANSFLAVHWPKAFLHL